MSLLQDLTHISLTTSRASAIRMLNAVIINMGATELITGSDDRDAILKKIEAEEGGLFRISIPALLDAEAMKDGQLRQKHEDYAARKEAGTVSDEEGYDDFCDDMTTDADMIDIVDVLPDGVTCEIKFVLYECEGCACYSDWCDWGDIVKVYGGRVLMDNDLYRNGRFEEFCGTTVWKEENGVVKEDRISPLLEVDKYLEDFDRLVRLDPDRYRQRYLDSLEENVRVLQRLIDLEKNNKAVDADIPEAITWLSRPYGNFNLRSIHLPVSRTDIKELAFEGCPCLADLKERYHGLVKETPDEWIRKESEDRTAENDLIDGKGHAVIPEGTVEIEPEFFEDCKGLVSVEIPSTVRVIGYGAFFGCTGLTSVVIPESTVEIQECAFKGCTALSDVVIPEGTDISFDAFEGCPCEKDVEKRLG